MRVDARIAKLIIFSTVVFAPLMGGCESPSSNSATTQTGTVILEIDFNGRAVDKTINVQCSSDSTVLSILQRADERGAVDFTFTGSGKSAFITAIDGVVNEKANGDNWVYRVNGELGNRGSGDSTVKAGDTILWRFGKYSEAD